MSNKSNTTEKKNKRIKYGFKMEFPTKPFTVANLQATGAHPKYITAYARVQKALKAGLLEVVGEKTPKVKRRGARELLYQRVNAKETLVTKTNEVEVAAAPDVAGGII